MSRLVPGRRRVQQTSDSGQEEVRRSKFRFAFLSPSRIKKNSYLSVKKKKLIRAFRKKYEVDIKLDYHRSAFFSSCFCHKMHQRQG